jgi:hypothetical protein
LQSRIFAKNVASLPKALHGNALAAIYPIRGGASPTLELPPAQSLWQSLLSRSFDELKRAAEKFSRAFTIIILFQPA